MAIQVRIIAQQVDSETNELVAEQEVFTKLAVAPIKIDDLGFSHKEQMEILQGSQEMILQAQAEEINHQSQTCPQCRNKTKKNGKFSSAFHAVFTDHKIKLQRAQCTCGWSSKISIDGMFGNALHPDLLELQSLYGANTSFKKVEDYLAKRCQSKRPINNHDRIKKTVKQVGEALRELKLSAEWVDTNQRSASNELFVNIDGGHLHTNTQSQRSIEAIVATIHNPNNVRQKDKNHNEITDKTIVASAKNDRVSSMKELIKHACQQQGMTAQTRITVFCDGASNCWSAASQLEGECASITKILDWFHIGKKFKNLQSTVPEDQKEQFEKAKWCLWHGNTEKALSKLSRIKISLTEGINKFQSLITYIKNNSNNITNYEERYTQGLTITSNVAESSVNNLINERQKHDGRMQWSRDGADNVLQIRSSIQSNNWQKDWNDVKAKIYRKAA